MILIQFDIIFNLLLKNIIMENKESNQHVQVPNKMADHNLTPRDQYIYSVIKSHDGKSGCFPSLKTISTEADCSVNTVRKSITALETAGYISTKKVGRQQYYFFSKYKKFEPISPEFLRNKDLSVKEKSYIIASQQYMYKDTENYGKVSLPMKQLSKLINMPETTIHDCNTSLKNKGFLTEVFNKSIELDGTGVKTRTKIFYLTKMGQAIIWKLKDHEDRINKNTQDISNIKTKMEEMEKKLQEQQKLIDKLLDEKVKDKNPNYNIITL